jgi:hypothetical protein
MELLEILDDVPWQMPTIEEEDEEPAKEEVEKEDLDKTLTEEDFATKEEMGDWELYEEKFPEAKKRFEEVLKKNRKPVATANGKVTIGIDQSTLNGLIKFEAHRRHEEEGIRMRAQHEAEKLAIDEMELDVSRASCSQPHPWKFTHPL